MSLYHRQKRKPFRDPNLAPLPTPEPEPGMYWHCVCGRKVLQHENYCGACGWTKQGAAQARKRQQDAAKKAH